MILPKKKKKMRQNLLDKEQEKSQTPKVKSQRLCKEKVRSNFNFEP